MNGLVFDTLVPTAPIDPNRADVACFVGFVARRKADQRGATRVVPSSDAIRAGLSALGSSWPVFAWLDAAGWTRHPYEDQNPQPWTRDHADLETLLDLPVPIEDWETFDRLFAWDERPIVTSSTTDVKSTALLGTTTLGAAVRSFFVQGGRRCYVIRVGDPWSLDASLGVRQLAIGRLLPGFPSALLANRIDRTTWSGIGHLFGLPDVSFVCMPDLADAVSMEYTEPKPVSTQPEVEPVFVEYSTNESVSEPDHFVRGCFAPRCTEQGYKTWAKALQLVARMLQEPANGLREVQLVASVPLPTRTPGAPPAGANLLTWLASEHDWLQGITNSNDTLSESFGSAFVQLAWPWVKTMGARNLPEALESPDAVLVGVLARNALTRGAFRSATGLPLADVHDVYPPLRGVDLTLSDESDTLIGRVSLLGPDAGMMRLLSDVTTFPGYGYRQANVNRLLSAIVRAARRLGEDFAFATSGPELWTSIRTSLNALLTQLWHDGALRGQSAKEAFSVRCDRTLMTEQDIDEGRVLVEVQFEAASAIEQIRVVLALANGTVSVAGAKMSERDAPLQGFNFEVTFTETVLDGSPLQQPKAPLLCSGAFSEVTGLEATMEPKVIKEGGQNFSVAQRPGPITFATVILKRGMTRSRDLWKWFDLIGRGRYAKRLNVKVAMRDESGATVLTWVLRRALPVKFKAADLNALGTSVAIEELHIAHEGLTVEDSSNTNANNRSTPKEEKK